MNFLRVLRSKISAIRKGLKYPGKGRSDTYVKYPKHSTFEGRKVLNLGCGNTIYPAPNVVNVDYVQVPGVNVVHDLSKMPLPFEDNTFDLVIANHILEHVPNWWECFRDLARVVKVGGWIVVWGPGDGTDSQLGYRDHINVINNCSFAGVRNLIRNFANAWEEDQLMSNGYVKDLILEDTYVVGQNYWWMHILPERTLKWVLLHLRNVVQEMGWGFRKLPPLRTAEEYKADAAERRKEAFK